jgi:ribosome-binding protein aMBF1 (putative translation factor)
MSQCEVCGNDYDKAMEITIAGASHVFDSFECAIHALAPRCKRCGVTIAGHGIEVDGAFYCCAHCAEKTGAEGLQDRA